MNEKQLEKHIEMQKQHLSDYKRIVTAVEMELVAFEAELAEAKPKLRHGDYAYASDGGAPRLYINMKGGIVWCDDEKIVDSRICGGNIILGNIFDDLTALAKPLKEFTLDETFLSGCIAHGKICLIDSKTQSIIPLAKARELVMYLRRLIHTAEQEKAKNKD